MKKKRSSDKVRVELRLDKDVAEGIQKHADAVGISMNQLLQGSCRWILEYGNSGEPYRAPDGKVSCRDVEGCFWFGIPAAEAPEDVIQEYYEEQGRPAPPWSENGEIYGYLDFTDRRVVRRDFGDYS